ncbi:MAG: DUF4358 domain-containing protein [Oscillospiraceae bacterium]|nr:DUF4358 domain-containing protein [Oscillospiraceae bacterium]
MRVHSAVIKIAFLISLFCFAVSSLAGCTTRGSNTVTDDSAGLRSQMDTEQADASSNQTQSAQSEPTTSDSNIPTITIEGPETLSVSNASSTDTAVTQSGDAANSTVAQSPQSTQPTQSTQLAQSSQQTQLAQSAQSTQTTQAAAAVTAPVTEAASAITDPLAKVPEETVASAKSTENAIPPTEPNQNTEMQTTTANLSNENKDVTTTIMGTPEGGAGNETTDGSSGGRNSESAKSGDSVSDSEVTSAAPVSAQKIYEALQNAATLREMFSVPQSVIPDYYGIFPEDYSDAVFMMCTDSLLADEFVIIRAVDDAAAKRLNSLLKKRLQDKADEARTYSPEQFAIINKGFVSTDGLWVSMIVSPDVNSLKSAYQKALR